mmetsp:Transcript_47755/g.139258  ORF Transcript_47755/g.139258 Transcript_47755/m.139258 type:complete len:276 (+) Transcript_47755:2249-3076(+)
MTTATTLVFGRTPNMASRFRRLPAHAESTSKRSSENNGRAACAVGSPKQVRKAETIGPFGVKISSVCRQPTKARSSCRKASKIGPTTSSATRCKPSSSKAADGAKAPMPSVMAPRSPSRARFCSCTATGRSLKRTPSLNAKTDTSTVDSSPSFGRPGAMGIFKRSTRLFEKARDDSISAATCEGPKVGTPALLSWSARPSLNNCSWPITASTIDRSLQKSFTSLKCGGVNGTSTGTIGAECMVPLKACGSSSPCVVVLWWPLAAWPELPALPGAT